MAATAQEFRNEIPIYGSLVGIALPKDVVPVVPGLSLHQGVFDTFSVVMMGFREGVPMPTPVVAVHGLDFMFKARAEIALTDGSALFGQPPSRIFWLLAVLLRLKIDAPVRIAAIANEPLASLPQRKQSARMFEGAPYQNGHFRADRHAISEDEIAWLASSLPVAVRMLADERFSRALSIFDESIWSGRLETATTLVWTALEILLDCGGQQHKTKAIASALSKWVGHDPADCDRAYNVVAELYGKRGRVVHAGRELGVQDFLQSHQFARVALHHAINSGRLPPSPSSR